MRINMNELARAIVAKEGKKKSVNIGQIKEILKITLKELDQYYPSEVLDLIERVGEEK